MNEVNTRNSLLKFVNKKENLQNKDNWMTTNLTFEEELEILKKSYPSVIFESSFDESQNDYKIDITSFKKTQTFYWANGLYLPKSELSNKEKYWKVIIPYKNKILDPKDFTQEQIDGIRNFGSAENRKKGKVSSKAIFTAIFDASTRGSTEKHIIRTVFLGKNLNVHEYLKEPLNRVEKKIKSLSLKNEEIKKFVNELGSCGGYNWREIRDVNTRSFHSFGIAVDILPYKWGSKIVYWGYEKANGNDNWMLIPLEKRWMPPKEVRDIFLEEGFIWGGNWAIWDNMHFEYHPELVLNYINELKKSDKVAFENLQKVSFKNESENIIIDNSVLEKFINNNHELKPRSLIKEYAFEYFIIDFLVIMALYNFLIFFLNPKQKMFLFLGLICINSLAMVVTFDYLKIGFFLSSQMIERIKIVSLTLSVPLYNLYTVNLYDTKVKWNKIVIYASLFISLSLLFVPYNFLLIVVDYFFIWFSLIVIYHIVYSIVYVKKNKKMYFCNTAIIILFTIISFLVVIFFENSETIIKIIIILFNFIQSFVAGIQRDILEAKVQQELKKYEELSFSYSKFLSKQAMKYLQVSDFKRINFNKNLLYEGMILVIRIPNFVEIEKKLSAKDFVKMLTQFYEAISLSAKKNNGFFSQFVGDEIIAIFEDKNDAVCKCALCVLREAKRITKDFLSVFDCSLEVQIGINVGKVCFGFTGNDEYACTMVCSEDIDKTVQLAKDNDFFDSDILVTENALDFCRSYTDCLFEGVIRHTRGKDVLLYKIIEYDNTEE